METVANGKDQEIRQTKDEVSKQEVHHVKLSTEAFQEEFRCCDDDYFTYTSSEQKRVEDLIYDRVLEQLTSLDEIDDNGGGDGDKQTRSVTTLHRDKHLAHINKSLLNLPRCYEEMESSSAWIVYWSTHAMCLLGKPPNASLQKKILAYLKACECESGGYGGSPGLTAHLAPTYAAVMSLCSIGTPEAFKSINRRTLYAFLTSIKREDGGFHMQHGGEVDVRGSYCALAVASITNILTDRLLNNADSWIMSCQTYEGGFAAEAGCEAHGGYTFCAVAALMILGHTRLIHLHSLLKWLTQKQLRFEGGFQGRTNKLVDGCYSFWQQACFPMIREMISTKHPDAAPSWLYSTQAAQEYILYCAQHDKGGMVDKPGRPNDLYHTCYALSGLSISQHLLQHETNVVGNPENLLEPTHPVYNITVAAEKSAREYFAKQPSIDS